MDQVSRLPWGRSLVSPGVPQAGTELMGQAQAELLVCVRQECAILHRQCFGEPGDVQRIVGISPNNSAVTWSCGMCPVPEQGQCCPCQLQDSVSRGAMCPTCSPGQHPKITPACKSLKSLLGAS